MEGVSSSAVKKKLFHNEENDSDSDIWSECDDSVKDKDYTESTTDHETSDLSEIEVKKVSRGKVETPQKKKPSRKRQTNIECRKTFKAKKRRNLGHGYTSPKGVCRAPRTLGPPCKCKKKCRELLHGEKETIFNSFWELATFDRQNAYLFEIIKSVEKKRVYPKKTKREKSSRSTTFKYYIKVGGKDVEVCKEEFLAIHGLQNSQKRVYNICKQIRDGSCTPKSDGRGKHKTRKNRLPKETIQSVHDHINSIPKYVSHYSRKKNPHRSYIDYNLSISSLYSRFYVPWCQERARIPVKEDRYRRIFCSEFYVGFKLPRSDTCATCDEYHVMLDTFKDNEMKIKDIRIKLELHQRRAEVMQTNLKNETQRSQNNENKLDVISFDLQQALPIPKLTVGKAFYLRKAWMYNLGVHSGNSGFGHMYMWTENIDKRGSDEIASCILKYFNQNSPEPNKNLIVFTDNCGGQNKNWTIMALWFHLVRNKVYKSIEHRFLVAGHTHLPCDRDFAAIEKHKKYLGQIYSPTNWIEAVKESRKKNPFYVIEMSQQDFSSFDSINKTINKKQFTDNKGQVHFSKVRCFKFEAEHPSKMFIKHFLNEEFKAVTIGKRGQKLNQLINFNTLHQKYNEPVKLNQKKKLANLKALLPFIPSVHHQFYLDLGIEGVTANEEGDGEIQNIDGAENIENEFENEDNDTEK